MHACIHIHPLHHSHPHSPSVAGQQGDALPHQTMHKHQQGRGREEAVPHDPLPHPPKHLLHHTSHTCILFLLQHLGIKWKRVQSEIQTLLAQLGFCLCCLICL